MVQLTRNQRRWISLGEACRILDVNEATLRAWADRGQVRVFRTPGGHRRFLRDDLDSIAGDGRPSPGRSPSLEDEDAALRRIRRRLQGDQVSHQGWFAGVDEDGRQRLRLFGRRLLSLLVRAGLEPRRGRQAREEALVLGKEYAQEMTRQGVSFKDVVEAFIFFRNNVMESSPQPGRRRVAQLADLVLLGLADSYELHNGQGVPK